MFLALCVPLYAQPVPEVIKPNLPGKPSEKPSEKPEKPAESSDKPAFTVRGLQWGANGLKIREVEQGRVLGYSQFRIIYETFLKERRWRVEYTLLNNELFRIRMNTKELGSDCMDVYDEMKAEMVETYGEPSDQGEEWKEGVEAPFSWFGLRKRSQQCAAAEYGAFTAATYWQTGNTRFSLKMVGEKGVNGLLIEFYETTRYEKFLKFDDSDEEFQTPDNKPAVLNPAPAKDSQTESEPEARPEKTPAKPERGPDKKSEKKPAAP